MHDHTDILLVSSETPPAKLGGAIMHQVRERGHSVLQAVGAASINQAVKAIAAARGMASTNGGTDLACFPSYAEVVIGGQNKTAIRFIVSEFNEAEL